MLDSTKKTVFFSYSWKDQPMAMRIFYDLTRSGISVWRDKVDAEKTNFHFLKDIFKVIDKVDYFLLIDSPNSRESFFVRKEVEYFRLILGQQKIAKKLVICLIEDKEITHQATEFFIGQNYWNYFNFSGIEVYDTHQKYRHNIALLVETLGGILELWTDMPAEKDFEDEISSAQITDEDRMILLNDFKSFHWHYLNGNGHLETRLTIIIDDCKYLGILAVTPYLSLGILQVELGQKQGGSKKIIAAKNTWTEASKRFPMDPRVWRGIGGVAYYQGKYEIALVAYDRAILVTQESGNDNFMNYLPKVKAHKAEVLLKAEHYPAAKILLEEIFQEAKQNNVLRPTHYIDLAFVNQSLGDNEKCKTYLIAGLLEFPNNASILLELGGFLVVQGLGSEALDTLYQAVKYAPKNIHAIASLSILNYYQGRIWCFRKYARRLLRLSPKTTLDHYVTGRVRYLKKDVENAKINFLQSKGEIGPYYDEL